MTDKLWESMRPFVLLVPNKWEFTRGFISSITCTAEDFLKHADELVWNEKMTDPCESCRHSGWESEYSFACDTCQDTHRVPRPCPETAQPITKVKLTTLPGFNDSPCDYLRIEHVTGERQSVVTTGLGRREHRIPTSKWDATDRDGRVKMLFSLEWPGIEFELPGSHPIYDLPPDFVNDMNDSYQEPMNSEGV